MLLRRARADAAQNADFAVRFAARDPIQNFRFARRQPAQIDKIGGRRRFLFFEQQKVYSIKGALGQTGAVTPALQAIAAALSLENGILPPTVNTVAPDARCPLNLVTGKALKREAKYILTNAVGFGGFYYASSVFAAF